MKMIIGKAVGTAALAMAVVVRAALPVNDDFQGYPVGTDFTLSANYWSSDAGVRITNGVNRFADAPATNSVELNGGAGLTNAVDSNVVTVAWTDFHIKPFKGDFPSEPPTNAASHVHYYDTNGYVVVAVSNRWITCSNDVWGMPVPPITDNWVHISIYQNYATSNSAMMVNDQIVLQDLPFVGSARSYGKFITRNASTLAWIDDVWIQTTANPSLSANRNGDAGGLADALELQLYGYAARTQYVGAGYGYPSYPTLTEALNAWRARDVVCVHGGPYSEPIVLSGNVVFCGDGLTNFETIVIASGASVVFQALTCSNLVVEAGASVTFGLGSAVASLSLDGTLTQTAGTLACGTVTVGSAGLLSVVDGATFLNDAALSLVSGGRLEFLGTESRFVSLPGAVDMSGQFVVTNNLADRVVMGIPFADDFQKYALGSRISALGFRGWDATDGVVVTNGSGLAGYATGRTVSRAVCLPDGTVMSNRVVSAAGQQQVWTDYYLSPAPGVEPANAPTGTATFAAFVDSNGWLEVATTGGWVTCSRNYTNGPVPVMAPNTFSRVTVRQDFARREFAVFLDGMLLLEAQPFVAGGSAYSSFQVHNRSGEAYLDDVRVTTALPDWMTLDLNGNGVPDAREIHQLGSLNVRGNVYCFR